MYICIKDNIFNDLGRPQELQMGYREAPRTSNAWCSKVQTIVLQKELLSIAFDLVLCWTSPITVLHLHSFEAEAGHDHPDEMRARFGSPLRIGLWKLGGSISGNYNEIISSPHGAHWCGKRCPSELLSVKVGVVQLFLGTSLYIQ